jgi:hypothetical protein
MDGKEFADALIDTIEARLIKRGDITLTLASLRTLVRETLYPEVANAFERPASPPQLPVEPNYPRLRVRYDVETHRALEYAVIEDIRSEIPYMRGWYIRPMSELDEVRRMTACDN